MDDLKLYARSEEQTNTFVRTIDVFSTDIGMEFGIHGYTYLGIIELDKIKETKMKEKKTKENKQKQLLILNFKLNGRIKVTAINT